MTAKHSAFNRNTSPNASAKKIIWLFALTLFLPCHANADEAVPTAKTTHALKSKVNPLTHDELEHKVAEMIAKVECAKLNGVVASNNTVSLHGFAGQQTDIDQLVTALQEQGIKVTADVESKPWPQCEALITLHEALAKTTDLKVTVAGTDTAILHNGEPFTVEVSTPAYPSYLYVTYIQANGEAIHLMQPNPQTPTLLKPNIKLVFGDDGKKTAAMPGNSNEMIVAIATSQPLFTKELPQPQIEREYLSQFRQAFLTQAETEETTDQVISAAIATLKRIPIQKAALVIKPAALRKMFDSEMVAIPGGCFQMGSPETEVERMSDEKQHKVCVKDFKLAKHEVTQAQWQAVMGNNPSKFKGNLLPVEQVSWNDVQQFIAKLNQKTKQHYRLPTEAEWEYAARAGTSTAFYTGNCISTRQANYNNNRSDYNSNSSHYNCNVKTESYKQKTESVGSYPANSLGLYDMTGNVWEWVCSYYVENYDGSETQCANSDNTNIQRAFRGGSWFDYPVYLRSAFRNGITPDYRNYFLGFRLSKI